MTLSGGTNDSAEQWKKLYPSAMLKFLRRHWILSTLGGIILLLFLFVAYRSIGPYRSYRVNLALPAPGSAAPVGDLLVGVAERDITPNLSTYDDWIDADGDGRYRPEKGDTYTDKNGNGRFDAVWMAGFSNNRPAKGVHDPLVTQALALRNNGVTLVFVTIDSIGIFHESFIDVRKRLAHRADIDHVMFSCSHDHEAPDTMGIWSYSPFRPLFDHGYPELVKQRLVEVVQAAVDSMRPVDMRLAEVEAGPEGYVNDSREPYVYDHKICCAQFLLAGTTETLATLVEWGNHVETLGSNNSLLTADFVHYWREGVENGVPDPNGREGLGGTCLFFVGQVGGLMTQLHTTVPHRNGNESFREASFEKAQALGENLAILTIDALSGPGAWMSENNRIRAAAQTVFIPISGLFEIAGILGLVHPGWFWGKGRTEIDAFTIGDLEILTTPGELYPEIGNGGVEAPEGRDYLIEPQEVPPLRSKMRGKLNMIIGLANDELGYFVPKSQWDTEPPFAYGREKAQYGEVNSMGPDAAVAIHRESLAVLTRLHSIE